MEYTYNILNEVYDWMISLKKDIEVRILKEKSSLIKVGDYINFFNMNDSKKYVKVKVTNKKIFDDVKELLLYYDVNRMMPMHSEEEFINLINNIYGDSLVNGKLVAFEFKYIESDSDSCEK